MRERGFRFAGLSLSGVGSGVSAVRREGLSLGVYRVHKNCCSGSVVLRIKGCHDITTGLCHAIEKSNRKPQTRLPVLVLHWICLGLRVGPKPNTGSTPRGSETTKGSRLAGGAGMRPQLLGCSLLGGSEPRVWGLIPRGI